MQHGKSQGHGQARATSQFNWLSTGWQLFNSSTEDLVSLQWGCMQTKALETRPTMHA